MNRRSYLAMAAASAVSGLAGCTETPADGSPSPSTSPTASPPDTSASPGSDASPDGSPSEATPGPLPDRAGLATVATGFRAPLDVAFAPDADLAYVADQMGVVRLLEDGTLREAPFLDLRDSIVTGGEKGLLGIALHPDFAENRRVFVRYSAPRRSGTPANYSHTFVLAEFAVTSDGTDARRRSERTVLEIPEPQGNHNAGAIAFGPEGYLYVAVGDGGAGGDQGTGHVEDWYDGVGGGNGQDVTENLLGSILRIDVDASSADRPYGIPDSNPLVGRPGLDEHYAWGLRNPWKLSFDGADLYVGDVGQNAWEEVDLVEAGGNYGWNVREGTHCYRSSRCPDSVRSGTERAGEELVDPIIEYPHSGAPVSGVSVIGGAIYRGDALPGLAGAYVFGDLAANGDLFVARPPAGGGLWDASVLPIQDEDAGKLGRLLSFGRDDEDELYVLGTGSAGGAIHRVVPAG